MKALLGWVGMFAGSALGWWLGAKVGLFTAVSLSAVGAGAGLYLTRRWLTRNFG